MTEISSLHHLNGNPLAVIDVETTGRVCGFHEVIQVAIVPLTIELEIADVKPFYCNIKPDFPERAEAKAGKVHGLSIDDFVANAPTQERVLDLLLDWFSKLPLGHSRRLTPVAHNWAYERSFLVPWLGPDLLNSIFHPHPRDTMIFAGMLNDRSVMMGKNKPFTSLGLGALCHQFGIPYENAHDALADCIATAKLYATLMRAVIR